MNDWEAFNRIQPIGQRRNDVYFSVLMSTLFNIAHAFSGSKQAKQFKAEDFVPNWMGVDEEDEEVMGTEQIKNFFIEFAKTHNEQVKRKQQADSRKPKEPKK